MINITSENFNQEVLLSKKPVVVDFWMNGCGPCVMLSPIMEKLAVEFANEVIFAKANFDEAALIAQKYGLNAAPTVILFKDGEPLGGFVGLRSEEEVRSWLKENLSKNNA